MSRAADALRKDLGRACRRAARRRHLPDLYRPASRPRSDQPAGVRGAARGRAQRAAARSDAGGARPQSADHAARRCRRAADPDRRSGERQPARRAAPQRRRVRRPLYRRARGRAGHRPCRRARAGLHAARHDAGVRRQPHLGARRAGRAGVRDRHAARSSMCSRRRRCCSSSRRRWKSASTARSASACRPRTSILAIIGRIGAAGGTGYVIEYTGDAIRGAVGRGAADRRQHVDRGRRARRADRARRDDLRLSQGPPDGARGRGLGRGGRVVADAAERSGRGLRRDRHARRHRHRAVADLGHQPRGRRADHRRRARSRELRRSVEARRGAEVARLYGPDAGHARCRTSASSTSSSAAAPTAGSRICAPPPRSRTAATSPTACARWSCRVRGWSSARPRPRGSTASSSPPGSNGASRAARCAWR